eukprot:CAMPEP_0185169310 /NCGR_PEP_ID=MMETSP1139-20130426/17089_1 /TAXON_ID=298111 /ORGANISM="Pavlova sp., Strain CCMP459" /LENGTH=92 /DNA_ID=CAMNT_0027734843 /DNA_START=216 /DNA_END=495 /DNA_ORIENTATION=-
MNGRSRCDRGCALTLEIIVQLRHLDLRAPSMASQVCSRRHVGSPAAGLLVQGGSKEPFPSASAATANWRAQRRAGPGVRSAEGHQRRPTIQS